MKNKRLKPEKIVERDVLDWAASKRWFLHVVDSKATYSVAKKRYAKSKSAVEGMPDLVGCDLFGTAVFIELKAPGKENVCRLKQRLFLVRAIENNAFACVVSSVDTLRDIYAEWVVRGAGQQQAYLKSKLPTKTLVGTKIMEVGV